MVACHLARHRPVDALVCDRTFASLDATAARLMVSVCYALALLHDGCFLCELRM
jgi:hypothetical protein